MKTSETVTLKGSVEIKLKDKDGRVIQTEKGDNLIVTVGKQKLAEWLAQSSTSSYFMRYVALGEGTSQPQATDTDLEDPLSPRVAGTVSNQDSKLIVTAEFGYGVCSGALTEVGLFSAETGGTMFARKVFNVVNKSDDMALEVTWQILIA